MMYSIIKAMLSGIIVALVSEVAKRSPGFGALIVSLPLLSILAIIWLWHDTQDVNRVAAHARATFWYVIPSLPMFLLFPALLRSGVGFWPALVIGCALTFGLYTITVVVAARFGIRL